MMGEASIRTATAVPVSVLLSPAVGPVVSAVEVCDKCEDEEDWVEEGKREGEGWAVVVAAVVDACA